MIEHPPFRAPRSRRQLLRSLAALGLLPAGTMIAGPQVLARRRRPKRPKFRLVTSRISVDGNNVSGGDGITAVLAESTELPQGTVTAIAVTVSDLIALDAGHFNAMVGTGRDPFSEATWGIVISDAGNGHPATGEDITISSRAKKAPPRTARLVSGTYRASNYDGQDLDGILNATNGFKSLLGKPAKENWFFNITNDGPSDTMLSVGRITLALTVKVRR